MALLERIVVRKTPLNAAGRTYYYTSALIASSCWLLNMVDKVGSAIVSVDVTLESDEPGEGVE